MNRDERVTFIHELITGVEREIMKEVNKIPEDWDGIELRWLVADRFEGVVWSRMNGPGMRKGKRYRDYHNTTITENLV